jgi:hypothetical protein
MRAWRTDATIWPFAVWTPQRRADIRIAGLDACLPLLT